MSVVRKFRPPNRLSKLIKDKGGILAKDAIAAAEAGVESLRDATMAALDDALAELERRFGPEAPRETETFDGLYVVALRIIDASSFVTDAGVDQAAISLAAVADSCGEGKAWRWDAVDVHLNALRLLRAVGAQLPAPDRQAMLEGLYKVSHRRTDEG